MLCPICGNKIPFARLRRGATTCSHGCTNAKNEAKRQMRARECRQCLATFIPNTRQHWYCSERCRRIGNEKARETPQDYSDATIESKFQHALREAKRRGLSDVDAHSRPRPSALENRGSWQ